jgi:hypothetical protein
MNHQDDTHTSIRIALPRDRCGEVRDIIEVLSVLEDVYNHLYAWHALAGAADGDEKPRNGRHFRPLPDLGEVADAVPADRRLCLARIEVEPPAFIEVVGARSPVEIIYNYLRNGDSVKSRAVERIEAVRGEIEHLCESSLREDDIQEAVSRHLIAPLKRLERLEGIHIYDNDEPGKAPVPRRRSDRPPVDISPLAREH